MLEVMEGAKLCGVIKCNNTWCDVYCDKSGVLAFDNYFDGIWCITEVNLDSPLDMVSTKQLVSNIEAGVYGECIGVIYSSTGNVVVLLDEEYAVIREVWALKQDVGERFLYSADEEYEVE